MRKRAKSQKVIFAHSLVNIMGAIGDRALAPMFLHPLQYGGRNLGKVYCESYFIVQGVPKKATIQIQISVLIQTTYCSANNFHYRF